MDFEFTEAQKLLQRTVRKFVKTEMPAEKMREIDEVGEFPDELWKKIADIGLCAIAVPKEYGGMGGSIVDLVIVTEELARGDLSMGTMFMNTQYSGAKTIEWHGSKKQKEEYLPKIAKGEIKFSFGFTEPSGGTDILGTLKTSAVKDGNDFVINGAKIFTTAATFSHYILLLTRTDNNPSKRTLGISLFIVPVDSPGLVVNKLKTFGLKITQTCETFYEDVRVPEENLVGDLHKGFYQLLGSLNNERILVAAMSIGNAQHALDEAIQFAAEERFAFGRPIGAFQAIQHKLAYDAIMIEAARLLTYKAAMLQSEGKACHVEAAMAKYLASEATWKTAFDGTRNMGGLGYTMEYDMQRYLRDAWPMMNGPMTNEQALNIIGEGIGLPKSY